MPGLGTDNRCAVEDCTEDGRPQVCLFDGRYHHHGGIHYTNDYGYPTLFGFRFRDLADGGWRGICPSHYGTMKNAMDAHQAARIGR